MMDRCLQFLALRSQLRLLFGLLVFSSGTTALWAQPEPETQTASVSSTFTVRLSEASGDPRIQRLESAAGASWELMPDSFSGPAADPEGQLPALQGIAMPADLLLQGVVFASSTVGDASRTGEDKSLALDNELDRPTVLDSPDRSAWYRLVFQLSAADLSDRPLALRLGQISDRDRTYFNGQLIGQTGQWDAPRPQGYDRLRIYEVPAGLLRPGRNVIHVQVQAYFAGEYGMYRDEIAIGPSQAIWRDYYLENTGQAFALIAYLTFGLYFLLFFLRRRHDLENLFFALFLFALVAYSFLATQFKYILGFELYELKRVQTISLFLTVPLFYQFLRSYYSLPEGWAKIWDRVATGVHAIPLIGVGIVLASESTETWQATVNSLVQPGWLIYIAAILFILIREAVKGNRDAHIMIGSTGLLLIALILDVLSGRAILNLPPLLTYGFVLFVISMALVLANRFVRLHDETEELNERLAAFNQASRRFVPFELLEMLDRGSIVDVNLGDQVQKEMTVLFSDIRSFTELSEQMSPQENFAFINSYLRRMGPVIREHDGFIDKYIGDAIMALFPEQPDDAFAAALQMQRSLAEWNQRRAVHGMQAIQIGVGINRGRLMLGTIGENERMEGTVISDAVNLAARIEGLTRMYGAAVLTGDGTCGALQAPDRYHFRRLDRVRVKGKQEVIDLLELLDALPAAERDARLQTETEFSAALEAYLAGRFAEAEQAFTAVARSDASDRAARLYVQRCRKLSQAGENLEWDGTTVLKSK